MEPIADHKMLIERLGKNTEVAEFGGWLPVTVSQWKIQNRIPPEHWPKIIEMAASRGVKDVDSDWFMNTWPARKNAAGMDAAPSEAA